MEFNCWRTSATWSSARDFRRLVPHGGSYRIDRKSTRLNSSHVRISYAVFCLKKKMSQNPTDVVGQVSGTASASGGLGTFTVLLCQFGDGSSSTTATGCCTLICTTVSSVQAHV